MIFGKIRNSKFMWISMILYQWQWFLHKLLMPFTTIDTTKLNEMDLCTSLFIMFLLMSLNFLFLQPLFMAEVFASTGTPAIYAEQCTHPQTHTVFATCITPKCWLVNTHKGIQVWEYLPIKIQAMRMKHMTRWSMTLPDQAFMFCFRTMNITLSTLSLLNNFWMTLSSL